MQIDFLNRLERENRQKALVATLVLHVLLLLLLFFLKAWQATDTHLEDAGIELNFGLDNVGSGDVQTRNQPNPLPNREESQPPVEKRQPQPAEPVDRVPPRVEPVRTKSLPVEEEPDITSRVESPVKVAERPVKKVERITKSEPKSEVVAKAVETPPAPPRQPDARTAYKRTPGSTGGGGAGNGTVGANPNPGGNNNGDDNSGVGDKGNPQGTLDAKALYGKPGSGGGGGSSLSLTGWTWTSRPIVNDQSSETGRIVIQIKVDDQGDIISVKILEKTVSQSVAELYKRAVERLSFVPTNASGVRPTQSTGTITFVIRSR